MWRPWALKGPIELEEAGIRAMTLVELSQLPNLIKNRTWVMLVLAPCVTCGTPKLEVMDTILHLRPHLITDLVCDSRTARALLPPSIISPMAFKNQNMPRNTYSPASVLSGHPLSELAALTTG